MTRERREQFVDYALADKRVVRLLDQAEELLLEVGSRINIGPRYESRAGGQRQPRRRPRQRRRG